VAVVSLYLADSPPGDDSPEAGRESEAFVYVAMSRLMVRRLARA
jgi:hypothetical protein